MIDRTFRAAEKVEQAIIDKREMQFLYRDGDDYVFMDNDDLRPAATCRPPPSATPPTTSSQATAILRHVRRRDRGRRAPGRRSSSTITETEPGVQGDRVSGARKPATLETGQVVQVPLFVNTGDRVKVDTRTGEYLTRV